MENIYIPFENFQGIGGPMTFMNNLKLYLDERDFEYQTKYKNAAGIFFPIQYDEKILKKIKRQNGKVIQRLDGIYYPSKHGDKHVELNQNIKKIYHNYADFVVFQSEYSKKQCFSMFGEKPENNYEIIINGVNKDFFVPSDRKWSKGQIRLVTASHFRNIDMIEPIILALDIIKSKYDFELVVIGPIVNPLIKPLLNREYIIQKGPKSLKEIAEIYQTCDIFLYSNLNPPCPNSVTEAISAGLPVVSFDSGAMNELCWFSKELLAYVSDDIFQKYEDFKSENFAEKIELCINEYSHFKKLALKYAHGYSMEECGKKYVGVFQKTINNFGYKRIHADDRNIVENNNVNLYNKRYLTDYRNKLSGYEKARYYALKHLITKVLRLNKTHKMLDYGSGSGLFVPLWEEVFPDSEKCFADISEIALDKLCSRFPDYKKNVSLINKNKTNYKDKEFDIIVSVEVMEHVENLGEYLDEIYRLLKDDGCFIWTTPSANALSIEHIYNKVFRKIEQTDEGYRRWKWEDVGHLRRLKTREIKKILINKGFSKVAFKHRAHIFSFLCDKLQSRKIISSKVSEKLMLLDYKLFRNFPNGASMIGYAKKKVK